MPRAPAAMALSSTSGSATPGARGSQDLRLRRALLRWFRKHARALPWRATRDPYRIWVSEIMLQQTQVATVIPYYTRFLRAFPSLDRLAQARLERILELWSGLGYYRRARHLHAAARKIAAEFEGRFPATPREARSLPGVGAYTAAAVLSMAYGVPLAVLDGNVARVVARLEERRGSLADPEFRRQVEGRLAALISRRRPGDFNQALMELGQTVCLPRAPRCPLCPLRRDCRAHRCGRPEAFPSPRPRRAGEEHHLAAAVIFGPHHRARGAGTIESRAAAGTGTGEASVLLVRGLDDGLMSDLWNFPSAIGASSQAARTRLLEKLAVLGGGPDGLRLGEELAALKHGVTYRKIQVRVYRANPAAPHGPGIRWLRLSRVGGAAVSQLARKITRALIGAGQASAASGLPGARRSHET